MPLAAAVGPVVGGALVQLAGWPAIFLVNLPITAFTFVFGWYVIPRDTHRQPATRFDLVGAIWLCALLVVGTLLLGRTPGGAVLAGACTALAVALVAFVRYEMRHRDPVLQPRLFTRRVFTAAAGGIALSNLAFYVTLLAVPILLHHRGVPEGETGLILGALTLASSPLAVLGGRLVDRVGLRKPAVIGLALVVAGLLPLAVVPGRLTLPLLAACLAVMGAGIGLSMAAFQLGAVHGIKGSNSGAAMGVFFTTRYLGSIIGSSLLAGVLAPLTVGFGTLFLVLAVVTAAGLLVATRLPGRAPAPAG